MFQKDGHIKYPVTKTHLSA